ncbi:thiol reductase thioredoxin [Streptococcus ursoris]|uniref:Thiol reductase thioredoxin n=1 Tax=Streptococcus ratti TaxID=1341 RepID=A0A7X9LFR3_STRRT|nr:thiol reductase thioredoxin [Streptococcus ratti]
MNYYKSLLLFSATALLLVGGTIYADEVSQSADQEQVPAVAAQTDSQENQQTTDQQILPAETNHQQKQDLTVPEEVSQVQDAAENQNQIPNSFDQEASNQAVEEQQNQQAPATESQAATAVTENESTEAQESLYVEEYEANVADLKQVTMADIYHMFDDQDGNYTLYIGRPTCRYCRDFSPVVKEFNELTGEQVYYLNTDNSDFTSASKEFLRRKIGEYATPTILHLDKGQIVSGQLGSGGTAQELYNKVFPAVSTEKLMKHKHRLHKILPLLKYLLNQLQ